MKQDLPILAIVGPTASGKGMLACEIADATGVSLVSVDSRKVYRRLNIGTAKPSPEVRARYRFGMIDCADPDQTFSAGEYARHARAIVGERIKQGEKVILVGGTGFYLDAFINGLSRLPEIDPEIRGAVLRKAQTQGWESIHTEISEADPAGARSISPTDKTRLLRSAEVLRQTGRPISEWQKELRPDPAPWKILVFAVNRPVAELNTRIEQRVRRMIRDGLIEETKELLASGLSPSSPGMSSVGYLEVTGFLQGRLDRARMVEEIVSHTRQYAKRQRTWFRHRPYVTSIDIEDNARQSLIEEWLK